ncbi:MAG: CDP-alcohol phosphatidyltransferase family protein, partial [Dehalococcoidia bacterium]|nr:CDP-alcohol phosphatidyltransferase family protein [Dehalococcoidia bacterium]
LVLALGWTFLGGFLVLFAGLFDMLDGAVARLSGQTTRFGALLDSVVDRFSEAAILAGLLWLYLSQQRITEVLLLFAVLLGSLMVSYVRARAEGLGLDCEVGLVARPERVLLLALGLLLSQMVPVLALLAILTHFTVAQRVWHIWQKTGLQELPGSADNDIEGKSVIDSSHHQSGHKKSPPMRKMI